jgi:hypothetical protein
MACVQCVVDFSTLRCKVCNMEHTVHTPRCMVLTSEQWVCTFSGECLDDIMNTVESFSDTQRSHTNADRSTKPRDAEIENDKRIKRIRSTTINTIKSVLCRITHTSPLDLITLFKTRPANALNMTHYALPMVEAISVAIHDILYQLDHNETTLHPWIELIVSKVLSDSESTDTRYSQNTDTVRRGVEELVAAESRRIGTSSEYSELQCFLFIFHQNSATRLRLPSKSHIMYVKSTTKKGQISSTRKKHLSRVGWSKLM